MDNFFGTYSMSAMKPYRAIISITVVWAFLFSIVPADVSYATINIPLSHKGSNVRPPAGASPDKLAAYEKVAQDNINLKNAWLQNKKGPIHTPPPPVIIAYYESGRMESQTLSSPDANGMVYYHYLNEDWNGQGYGRVDRSLRQTALNGELAYTYKYYPDSTGRLWIKDAYSTSDFNGDIYNGWIESYRYYNDSPGRLSSKVDPSTGMVSDYYNDPSNYISSITLSWPDANGMVYYHYLNEDWNGQGYGRVDTEIASSRDADGAIGYGYEYYADTAIVKVKRCYENIDYSDPGHPVFLNPLWPRVVYTYYNNASTRMESKTLSWGYAGEVVYYHWLDEDYMAQGFNRIDCIVRAQDGDQGIMIEYVEGAGRYERHYSSIDYYSNPSTPTPRGDILYTEIYYPDSWSKEYPDGRRFTYDLDQRLIYELIPGKTETYFTYYGYGSALATKTVYDFVTGIGATYAYNDDSTNYIASMTLTSPDESGNIYYHYLNENWNGQGYGRVSQSWRQEPLNGELSYKYVYYQDSTGRVETKEAYSNPSFTSLIQTYAYQYYSDSNISSTTLTAPDENGMTYYRYIDENWNGQGYGRLDRQIRSDGTVLIPGSQVTCYMQGTMLIVLGTIGGDDIKLIENAYGISVNSKVDGVTHSVKFASAISDISVYGFDGDDVITATSSVLVPVNMYGEGGNDQLFADNAMGDLLVGGTGDDLLVSINSYMNTLIGGDGLDSFWCDTGDDVIEISSAETGNDTVHRISQFYQPFTTDTGNANYITTTLAGQNLPDPIDCVVNLPVYTITNISSHPLFNNGMAYYNDSKQGTLGDCYFIAGLSSLAWSQPEIILQSIAPLGDGTYGVRFYRDGVADYLRIDGDILWRIVAPSYANFGSGGDIWAMLLEKAYAFYRYPGENTYSSLYDGPIELPFSVLTGLGYVKLSTSLPGAEISDVDYYNFLETQLSAGHAVSLCSRDAGGGMIIGYHAYSLQSVKTVNGVMYATIYNPWGVDGIPANYYGNYYDGLLTITIADLQQYFREACASLAITDPTP